MQIKSETLNQQIELLAQPVTKLTAEELALLRQPVVATSDSNPAAVHREFCAREEVRCGNCGPERGDRVKPAVPEELILDRARGEGKFRSRQVPRVGETVPGDPDQELQTISTRSRIWGSVYFRTGRLKAAELTLKKAVILAPKDEFSHRTLGIVYYRQAKYDDAVTELTKALAINPKSFIAHNYLGITASQKGWQEAAEKEMLEAIAANPGLRRRALQSRGDLRDE